VSDGAAFDVLVVGAGIAGSAAALACLALGYRVALVDPGETTAMPALPDDLHDVDSRVSALSPASTGLLDALGAWSRIDAAARGAYQAMRVWDADGSGSVGFEADEVGVSVLGHIVENRRVVAALHAALQSAPGLSWFQQDAVEALDESAVLQLTSGRRLRAGLVVGADGARSRLRQLAGIDCVEQDCRQDAIVATVRLEREHRGTAWQRFLPTGPLALLPLGAPADRRHCSLVWSADRDEAGRLLALDDAGFARALDAASERRLGGVEAVSVRRAFPLWQRHARRYTGPGLALVADAAHSIHPLAGQGINLGLRDVAVLAEELRRGRDRGLAPGEPALLGRYQRRRIAQNRLMLESMRGFQWLFGDTSMSLRLLRNAGLDLVSRHTAIKRRFMQEAMGL
jgi:2-octaprenylphenol hydroxylase